MGFKAVSPVIVNISNDFVNLLEGNSAWEYASKSLGFNYGSEYLKGYSTIIPTQGLNNHQLQDIFTNRKPWEIRESDLGWINKHCLLPKIKGREFDFEGFSQRFDNLDENFWAIARDLIPDEWLSDQFDRIKQHFISICNNRRAFIVELKKLMS